MDAPQPFQCPDPEIRTPDGQITRHFHAREFEVSRLYPELVRPVPADLRPNRDRLAREILEPIRRALGARMVLNSGYRPPALNRKLGGSPTSQHLTASAADWYTRDVEGAFRRLLDGEIEVPCGQCIFYPESNFVHVALPGSRYPRPAFFVHSPARGLAYARVSPSQLDRLLRDRRAA